MWSKDNYINKTNVQEIKYNAHDDLAIVTKTLSKLPSIVSDKEILLFSQDMLDVSDGRKFILHIGDCAELFENSNIKYLAKQLKLFNDAAEIVENSLGKSVCCIGRIAGQYAKPRSSTHEKCGTKELVSYYGDIVNSYHKTVKSRLPDPNRMLLGYVYSKKTYEYIAQLEEYYKRKFYISHEALLLPYEQALTKLCNNTWYNTSCHFPWIGVRTAFSSSSHIEYARGINNPIAVKIGPNISKDEILEITNILNPLNIPGKLTFIYRFGIDCVESKLSSLIETIKTTGLNVILCCDPMHGNTKNNNYGIKIREVSDILMELKIAINLHQKLDINLGGIHLEACGSNIYECLDDDIDVNSKKYKTKVDPRLNYGQTMKILHEIFTY